MKVIIPLVLLAIQFISSISFRSLEGSLFGFHWRTEALIAGTIGQLLSLYFISALVIYLLEKIQTKNGKRLLVGCFIILFALLWRVNLVDKAKSRMNPNTEHVSTVQTDKEIAKVFFEKASEEIAKASTELIAKLNLQNISDDEFSSKNKLTNVLKIRQKTLNEIPREKFVNEVIKEAWKAGEHACVKAREMYPEINCKEVEEERRKSYNDFKETANLFYDFKEAEFAFAKFMLDHYEDFTFGANGELENVSLKTDALRNRFIKLTQDVEETMGNLQNKANNAAQKAKERGVM